MTVAFYGFMLALMAVMRLAPDSAAGRLLNRQLVEVPLRMLGRMQRHHLIFVVLLVGLVMSSSELLILLGPTDIALLYVLDMSLYIDGLMMVMAMASLARTRSSLALLRAGAGALAVRARRVLGRRRVRRPPARRGVARPSNDDDHPDAAFALAA